MLKGSSGHANCVQLLADSPARQARRGELLKQKQSLLQGQALLDDLAAKYGDAMTPRFAKQAHTTADLTLRRSVFRSASEDMDDITYGGHPRH
jgi:hypothetical protein